MPDEHRLLVASQGGDHYVLDCEGEFFDLQYKNGPVIGEELGLVGLDDYPTPNGDGLWRLAGEVKHVEGCSGPVPREPESWMDGTAKRIMPAGAVMFNFDAPEFR